MKLPVKVYDKVTKEWLFDCDNADLWKEIEARLFVGHFTVYDEDGERLYDGVVRLAAKEVG